MRISLSAAWDETKAILARDGRLLAAVALAMLVLPSTVFGSFPPASVAEIDALFGSLFFIMLLTAVAGQIAINRLAIPPSSSVGESLKRGLRRTPIVIVTWIFVIVILVIVGTIAALPLIMSGLIGTPVPGKPPSAGLAALFVFLFLASFAVLQLIAPISAVEQGGPLKLIARAWTLSRANYLRLLAFGILMFAGVFLVWLTTQIIVGSALAAAFGPPKRASFPLVLSSFLVSIAQAGWTVVTSVMLAQLYRQVAGGADGTPSVPNSGT